MHDNRTFTRNVQEYMDMRRETIGVYPAITLAEYECFPLLYRTRDSEMTIVLIDLVIQICARHSAFAGDRRTPLSSGVHVCLSRSCAPVIRDPISEVELKANS